MNAHNAQQETMKQVFSSPRTRADLLTLAGLALSLFAAGAAVLAGSGSRLGWWHFMTGFSVLRTAAISGLIAAILSLTGGVLVRHEQHPSAFAWAAAGILIGLITAGIPFSWLHTARTMPPIHDISTDMVNPPRFVSIMPLRQHAENSAAYAGPEVANQQRAAFPDIRPIILPISARTAFESALRTANNMGWRIVDADESTGRVEAMATTFWFGFTDDVIVRLTPVHNGTRVDIRSVSRVGLSDIGTNANRIRSFLRMLAEENGN